MSDAHYECLNKSKRIGLLDSGVGGLTVLDKLKNLSSNPVHSVETSKEFVYLGDTARCPYGDRKVSELIRFVKEIINWLIDKNVDSIVMSCNTSASNALVAARSVCPVPIFDLITPTAQHLGKIGGRIAVMATSATASSQAFSKAIHTFAPHLEVLEIACPDLVPIIEKGAISENGTTAVLSRYADILMKQKIDTLVLGCTHFPFLTRPLKSLLPDEFVILDPADIFYRKVAGETSPSDSQVDLTGSSIYVTGDPSEFAQVARICLGYEIGTVHSITTDELVDAEPSSNVRPKQSSTKESVSIIPAV